MRAYSRMSLEDFASQLRDIVVAQPFTPRQPLLVDMIDEIVSPTGEDEIVECEEVAYEVGEADGEYKGRIGMYHAILTHFEDFGMASEIGLTETQHTQILELLGQVKS